jgi:hypothetical protein
MSRTGSFSHLSTPPISEPLSVISRFLVKYSSDVKVFFLRTSEVRSPPFSSKNLFAEFPYQDNLAQFLLDSLAAKFPENRVPVANLMEAARAQIAAEPMRRNNSSGESAEDVLVRCFMCPPVHARVYVP